MSIVTLGGEKEPTVLRLVPSSVAMGQRITYLTS